MKRTLLIIAALAVLGAGGYGAVTYLNDKPADQPAATQSEQSQPAKEFSYQGEDGKTALELLQAKANATTNGEGANAFVTAINGYQADSSKEFWAFYVNGEQAQVGAGSYTTKSTDQITWKVEAFK